MWKQELKEQIAKYEKVNNELTWRLSYMCLWEELYREARSIDKASPELIEKEVQTIKRAIDDMQEAFSNYYWF